MPSATTSAAPDPSSARKAGGLGRIFANLAHLLGGKAAAGIISLVYLVIATHRLGVADYGVLVLVNAYAVLIGSVVAFSGFHGVVRYGALALERGDPAGFARIVRHMAVIELGCGAAAIATAALLAPVVGPHLGWPPDTVRLAMLYSLAVVGTVRATPQGLLQLANRFDLLGLHQIIQPVVRLVGSVWLYLAGASLEAFIAVWLASSLAEGIGLWLMALPAWRRLSGESLRGPWRRAERDGFLRFILVTNVDITVRELAPNLAPLTLGWMLGPAAAGLLALAQRATALLAQPAVLLGNASYAVLAEQAARGELRQLRRTVWRSSASALAIAIPIVLALALGGERLMLLLGGPTFVGGTALLLLVACARAAALASAPIAAGLTALGLPQRSLAVGLATNLGFYPLLPLLLLAIGANGAGWHALAQGMAALLVLAAMFRHDARSAR